jgi:hypothetical protein
MCRPFHVFFDSVYFRKRQMVHKIALIKARILQQVHLVKLQRYLFKHRRIWMIDKLNIRNASDQFLDLKRWVLKNSDFCLERYVVFLREW